MDALQKISGLIKEYYSKADMAIDKIGSREFGFGTSDKKIAVRHLSFKTNEDLKRYAVQNAPFYVSYSSAYYRYAEARPMEKKEWLGSELVFDLDATDMNLECQRTHGRNFVCENCLVKVREEAVKLIEEFLIPDMGFPEKAIEMNFSGNRGYHIHIKDGEVLPLGEDARKEISDYISGNGISFVKLFPTSGLRGKALMGPKPGDYGWGGRIARSFIKALDGGTEALESMGIERGIARKLYAKRSLIEMGINSGNWDMVYIKKKDEFWQEIVRRQSIMQSDRIDRNVTIGIGHLIRLPGTIHGSSGLIAKRIKGISALASYEPMDECVAFGSEPMKIHIEGCDRFYMKGKEFGPYRNEDAELPAYAAIYLHLKGFGTIK